jgi:hypothetical protein
MEYINVQLATLVGAEEPTEESVDNSLQICNGLFSIAACIAQIIFMNLSIRKVNKIYREIDRDRF